MTLASARLRTLRRRRTDTLYQSMMKAYRELLAGESTYYVVMRSPGKDGRSQHDYTIDVMTDYILHAYEMRRREA